MAHDMEGDIDHSVLFYYPNLVGYFRLLLIPFTAAAYWSDAISVFFTLYLFNCLLDGKPCPGDVDGA